jgi:hypothetical protein
MSLKIWIVYYNDGGWHSSMDKKMLVAESKDEAVEKAKSERKHFVGDIFATEFEIEGYVIEVHEKSSWERNNKINNILD